MKSILAILAALAMTGCASAPYDKYSEMHIAYAEAQTAKYNAIGVAAASTDTTIGVASMFALMAAGGNGSPQIALPKSTADNLREWAGILVPGLLQFSGQYYNARVNMRSSDNATLLGVSTNDAFVNMAGQIQAPAANMTIGGSGVIGAGSYSTDTHAISSSYNPVDNSQQPVDNADNSVVYPTAP